MEQSPTGISPIKLPAAFCDESRGISMSAIQNYVAACLEFLTQPLVRSLLESHPNDVANDGPESEWLPWWDWAANGNDIWKSLVPGYHLEPNDYSSIPQPLVELLGQIDALTLPRGVDINFNFPESRLRGMSPKKAHEVSQMTSFLSSILKGSVHHLNHIVDVGAGQGYLSRALTQPPLSMNVLALDFSEVQIKGSERRTNNITKSQQKQKLRESQRVQPIGEQKHPSNLLPKQAGTLLHQTILINPVSLQESITAWLYNESVPGPIPIMCIALHACGSLTPDLLRFFLNNARISPDRPWFAAGLIVAGCCYNLMCTENDFPLSKLVIDANDELPTRLHLSYNHRSLASQSPLQWAHNSSTKTIADLAIRKVVYRALLGKLVLSQNDPEFRERIRSIKIGRLPDSTYTTFGNFVWSAQRKLGRAIIKETNDDLDLTLKSQLEVLHTLRSRIGPVIESLILVDRYIYLVEHLPGRSIQMNNLFEQSLGSGRNVVLSVLPQI